MHPKNSSRPSSVQFRFPRRGHFRPLLEVLEDRLAPATIQWINPAGGDWNVPGNWSLNRLPAAGDDVVIDVPGTVTVTHASGTAVVQSIDSRENFVLSGGILEAAGNVDIGGSFTLSAGTLRNAILSATTTVTVSGATLDAVTLNGTLNLPSSLTVLNGLTVNGTVNAYGFAAYLLFQGSQTLGGTGTIIFGNSWGLLSKNAGDVLTIGPNVTARGFNFGVGAFSPVGAAGTFVNQGTLISEGSANGVLVLSGNGWRNEGTVSLQPGKIFYASYYSPSNPWTNTGTMTFAGTTATLYGNQWTNTGTIDVMGGSVVTDFSAPTNYSNGTLTGGTWNVGTNSTLRLGTGGIVTNAAIIALDGVGSNLLQSNGSSALVPLDAIAAGASLTLKGGRSLTLGQPLTNAGNLVLASTSTLATGTLTNNSGATLAGSGIVTGNVVNAGSVIPGTPLGALTVNGNYTQTAPGTLSVELGGTTQAGTYDHLQVTGTATLGGSLNVATVNGFQPAVGDAFRILTASARIGEFASYTGLTQGATLLVPAYDSTGLTLNGSTITGNRPPVLASISSKVVEQNQRLIFTAVANDPNAGDVLSYSLIGGPAGATIDSSTGVFSWKPTLSQPPGNYSFTVRVTDSGGLFDEESVTVTVTAEPLFRPGDLLVADVNGFLVADGMILRVDPDTGAQSLVARGGNFVDPVDLTFDAQGNLLVVDRTAFGGGGGVIRVDRFTGAQTVVSSGQFFVDPSGIAVGPNGDLFIADFNATAGLTGAIIRVNPLTGVQTVFASGGSFVDPVGITLEPINQAAGIGATYLLVTDSTSTSGNGAVIRINLSNGGQQVVSAGGLFVDPHDLIVAPNGDILVVDFQVPTSPGGRVVRVAPLTGAQTLLSSVGSFLDPGGIELGVAGDLYVADGLAFGSGAIFQVTTSGTQLVLSSGGFFVDPARLLTVPDVAPTNIALDANAVAENAANGTVVGNLATTDPDIGDAHTYTLVQSAGGRFAIVGDQLSVANSSLLDFEAITSHTIRIRSTDSGGFFFERDFTITVAPVNEEPVSVADTYGTSEDTTLSIPAGGVLTNDTDVDGDALAAVLVSAPSHGMLTLNADGSFSYTPNPNFNGADSFTYRATDGQLQSNVATVTIDVAAVNDAPVATADSTTTTEDHMVSINVLANDTDIDGDTLTIASFSQGAHGTVTTSGGQLLYTPNVGFAGSDSFSYTVSDGHGGTSAASVSVQVKNLFDLSGRVFDDRDNDGAYNGADAGLAGVVLSLFDEGNLSASVATTTTDGVGRYTFDTNLLPGTYRIVRGTVVGLLDGKESAGSLGGTVDNANDSVAITGIVASDTDADGYNFGLIRTSRVQGLVWVDADNDGEVDFGEQAVAGVAVHLRGTDDRGGLVDRVMLTDSQGIFEFGDLRPADVNGYTLAEDQPATFLDGIERLGTVNGVTSGVAADNVFSQIALSLPGSDAVNYNFGERQQSGSPVQQGQTAAVGFWQNKNGQALINSLNGGATSTALADWLAATFPNLYGADTGVNDLRGKTNAQVAAFYVTLFKRTSSTNGPPKLDAQVLATAFAVYVTNRSLAGESATAYGFLVSDTGVGAATFDVGAANRAAFGLSSTQNTVMTVMDILLAVNARTRRGLLYDLNNDGAISSSERDLRVMANNVFSALNAAGDIP